MSAAAKHSLHRAVLLASLCSLSGCGGGLNTVPEGSRAENGNEQAVIVATPPPPAKVERVPTDPRGACAWLDGQWLWLGGRWQWQPGAWVVPPVGCRYVPPSMAWVQGTQRDALYYVHGGWFPAVEGQHCGRPQTCLAAAGGTE
jgi:hypothetical protein